MLLQVMMNIDSWCDIVEIHTWGVAQLQSEGEGCKNNKQLANGPSDVAFTIKCCSK